MQEEILNKGPKQAAKRRAPYVPGLLKAFQKAVEESAVRVQETVRHEAEKLGKMAAAIGEASRLGESHKADDDKRFRDLIVSELRIRQGGAKPSQHDGRR